MKKNILFAQSLVVLSLLTAAPVLGMDKQVIKYKEKSTGSQNNRKKRRFDEKVQQKKVDQLKQQLAKAEEKQQLAQQQQKKFEQKKQQITDEVIEQEKKEHTARFHSPLLQDLQSSQLFIKQAKLNTMVEVIENPLYNSTAQNSSEAQIPSSLVQSETEVTTLALPERATNNNTNDNQPNNLLASVILPTQEKALSWKEKFNYYTSTANQLLLQVMDDLETGAFDVRYKNSFDLLEEAIATATKNNDVAALAKIAALCQQKYEIWVRISDAVAQPAAELLASHYSKELTLANNTLEQKLEERTKEWNLATVACMHTVINTIAMYQENMKKMQDNYSASLEHENKRITNLRRDVSTFACLNRTIRPATAELLTNNQLKTPKNDVHSSIISAAAKKIDSVKESVELISTIQGFQVKPKYAEELTQKCLTNK